MFKVLRIINREGSYIGGAYFNTPHKAQGTLRMGNVQKELDNGE